MDLLNRKCSQIWSFQTSKKQCRMGKNSHKRFCYNLVLQIRHEQQSSLVVIPESKTLKGNF